MDLEKFKRSSTGKLKKTSQGYHAFVPHSLPPSLSYPSRLVQLLSDADRALGALEGKTLPIDGWLVHPPPEDFIESVGFSALA
jgi:hypothetical protein